MNINLVCLNNLIIAIDKCSDYVPGVSSLTNICCIFQKCILSLTSKKDFVNSYTSHVYHKNLSRCLIACMPILGNIALAIYDDQKIVEGREIPETMLAQEVIRKIKKLYKDYKPWLGHIDQLPENRLPKDGRASLAAEFFLKLGRLIKELKSLDSGK
ncbi:MAG TPA: hypothetical protein VGZ69_03610 [Candidatus Rhabdochlamydia sp.]|jgi:hypothetical protein|nr:hypothetical protein [Candidatus Rhabdochlamydia sp.]